MPPKDQKPNKHFDVIAFATLAAICMWLIIYIAYKLTHIFWFRWE